MTLDKSNWRSASCVISSTATICCTRWACSPARPARTVWRRRDLRLLGHLCGSHQADVGAVTVVFDASGAPGRCRTGGALSGHPHLLRPGRRGGRLIEDLIQREATPRQLTVVSDDHRVQHAGRRRRCPVLGCMDYLDDMSACATEGDSRGGVREAGTSDRRRDATLAARVRRSGRRSEAAPRRWVRISARKKGVERLFP